MRIRKSAGIFGAYLFSIHWFQKWNKIYDIIENNRRNKLVKLLEGYGFRVQKSAFESRLSERQYQKLLCDIEKFAKENDNIRIYKINGQGEIHSYGIKQDEFENEVLIL